MALQFCRENIIAIKNANARPYVLTAENAGVAQATVGTTYLCCMTLLKHGNMLYMLTTNTFVHAQNTSVFAFNSLAMLPSIVKNHALLVGAKQ